MRKVSLTSSVLPSLAITHEVRNLRHLPPPSKLPGFANRDLLAIAVDVIGVVAPMGRQRPVMAPSDRTLVTS
jgi:hypothetical protein